MLSAGLALNLGQTLLLTSWLAIRSGESGGLASEPLAGCLASNNLETICALKTEADKYLEWSWFESGHSLVWNSSSGAGGDSRAVLDGTLRLGIGKSAFALKMDELEANLKVVHKAKVFSPFYPITSNEQCEFSFSYRINERSSYVDSAIRTPTQTDSEYRWPKVSVVLVRPASEGTHKTSETGRGSLAEVRLLDHFEHLGSYLANEFDSSMLIGRQMAGSWRLAILIETRLDAKFLEFTRMKLTNCQPTSQEMHTFASNASQREIIDLDAAFATTCNNAREQFQCSLSGRCLSLDYRCDFGHDCGPYDDSDEFRCSADFEGRCDFEENSDLCEWAALPRGEGNSWTWSSVADHTTIEHKPPLDHSLQEADRGHYLLLGLHRLEAGQNKQLIGPRVQLKAGHSECKFRFWAYAPASLRSTQLKSTTLTVGYQQIGPADLFGETGAKEHREENNWRRFQVPLLTRSFHNESLFALHITFGKFFDDLELLSLADAYLALDDFSFSPGCALTFYNKPPPNVCGDTEFECDFAPPEAPTQFCLPSNRVCDFKNDCGHHGELSASGWSLSAASDEAHCMSSFSVESPSSFVGLELSGIQVVNPVGGRRNSRNHLEANEAFELLLPEGDPAEGHRLRPFKFSAQYEKFTRNLRDHASEMRHVLEAGLLLPRFHQAHANCRLHLNYAWDMESRNLLASVHVIRSGVSTLYRRWTCGKDLGENGTTDRKLTLTLGLGEQNAPFTVQLGISVESFEVASGNAADAIRQEFSGSFSLTSYHFESCAYQAGRVSVPQADMIPIGDVDEESDYGHESRGAGGDPLLKCPETQFQCGQPILCLDERLVCDKQRDCQESGADEADCASRGYIQYDFEDPDRLGGWWPSLTGLDVESEADSLLWSVMSSSEFGSRHESSLPPVDHTLGRASGHFLGLRGNEENASGEVRIASIMTPAFEVHEACKRLVLYIFENDQCDRRAYSFTITYFNDPDQPSLDEITLQPDSTLPPNIRAHSWQRLEFELPHANNSRESNKASRFTIGIYGGRDPAGASKAELAIDDMTLGPKCHLSTGSINHNRHHNHAQPKTTTSNSSPCFWWRLMGFTLLAVVCCLAGLLVHLDRRSARDKQSPRSEDNYLSLIEFD